MSEPAPQPGPDSLALRIGILGFLLLVLLQFASGTFRGELPHAFESLERLPAPLPE